jgi:hypothetical protein
VIEARRVLVTGSFEGLTKRGCVYRERGRFQSCPFPSTWTIDVGRELT